MQCVRNVWHSLLHSFRHVQRLSVKQTCREAKSLDMNTNRFISNLFIFKSSPLKVNLRFSNKGSPLFTKT